MCLYLSPSMKFLSYQPMVKALSSKYVFLEVPGDGPPGLLVQGPKARNMFSTREFPIAVRHLELWPMIWTSDICGDSGKTGLKNSNKKDGKRKKTQLLKRTGKSNMNLRTSKKKCLGTPLSMPGFCRICRTFVVMPRKGSDWISYKARPWSKPFKQGQRFKLPLHPKMFCLPHIP